MQTQQSARGTVDDGTTGGETTKSPPNQIEVSRMVPSTDVPLSWNVVERMCRGLQWCGGGGRTRLSRGAEH